MLDVDHSGLIDFDEFYVLICILLAVRVCKQHHNNTTTISNVARNISRVTTDNAMLLWTLKCRCYYGQLQEFI